MGNHEYCTECGEDDFHYGYPCDPIKKAAQQGRKRKIELERNKRIRKLKADTPTLKKMGYEITVNEEYGYAQIRPK